MADLNLLCVKNACKFKIRAIISIIINVWLDPFYAGMMNGFCSMKKIRQSYLWMSISGGGEVMKNVLELSSDGVGGWFGSSSQLCSFFSPILLS